MQPDRRAVDRPASRPPPGSLAWPGGRPNRRPLCSGSPCRVRRWPSAPRAESRDLPSTPRRRAPLSGCLGQELGDAAGEIGLDVANALRLAVERGRRVQERVVVELDERLERDPEPAAIIQDRVMMIGNAPRSRIDVEARIELAGLGRAASSVKTSPPLSVQFRPPGRRLNSRTLTRYPARSSSIAAVIPARPAPKMTTEAPFGSPSSLIGPRYGDSDAKPSRVMTW